MSGIEMANWNWKVVRQFVSKRFGIGLSRSACLNYLHRLGFVLKRPKKRLVKADEQKREAWNRVVLPEPWPKHKPNLEITCHAPP